MPVCIVGAADGKFVLPLARRGVRVVAIETDSTQVYGGFTEGMCVEGLLVRLQREHLTPLVEIFSEDFMRMSTQIRCRAIFTSCSWHYPQNLTTSLGEFIGKMQRALLPAGLFAAEYMMPVPSGRVLEGHYPQHQEVIGYFPEDRWRILHDIDTSSFVELPHIGQPFPHEHRMGFIMAKKKE